MTIDLEELQLRIDQLAQQYTQDSAFLNILTGSGLSNRDKLTGFSVAGVPDLPAATLTALYRSDTFGGNVVELLPDAATKKWLTYTHEGEEDNPDTVAAVQAELDKLKGPINEAWVLARLYGGACIILGADDGSVDFKQPLNLHQLRAIRWHTVISKEKIKPVSWGDNPMMPDYNKPILYEISSKKRPFKIHASRLLRLDGVKLPAEILRENKGWGDSVILRCYRDMVAFEGSLATIASALQDFEVATLELDDITATMNKDGGKGLEALKERAKGIAFCKNALGIMVLKADKEKYSIVGRNFAQIPELLTILRDVFIGSTDLPPSKLMSVFNSAGLASEDTTQQREWADFVLGRQEDDLRPLITHYLKLLHLCKEGPTKGVIPNGAKFTFEPIFQLNEQEQAKLHGEQAKSHDIYLKNGVVSALEVAEAIAKEVPLSSVIDLESRQREVQAIKQLPEGQYSGEA
jgi:uncharacterized protein